MDNYFESEIRTLSIHYMTHNSTASQNQWFTTIATGINQSNPLYFDALIREVYRSQTNGDRYLSQKLLQMKNTSPDDLVHFIKNLTTYLSTFYPDSTDTIISQPTTIHDLLKINRVTATDFSDQLIWDKLVKSGLLFDDGTINKSVYHKYVMDKEFWRQLNLVHHYNEITYIIQSTLNKKDKTFICGPIHQIIRTLLHDAGLDAVVCSGRVNTQNKDRPNGHQFLAYRLSKNSYIFQNYGDTYTVEANSLEEAFKKLTRVSDNLTSKGVIHFYTENNNTYRRFAFNEETVFGDELDRHSFTLMREKLPPRAPQNQKATVSYNKTELLTLLSMGGSFWTDEEARFTASVHGGVKRGDGINSKDHALKITGALYGTNNSLEAQVSFGKLTINSLSNSGYLRDESFFNTLIYLKHTYFPLKSKENSFFAQWGIHHLFSKSHSRIFGPITVGASGLSGTTLGYGGGGFIIDKEIGSFSFTEKFGLYGSLDLQWDNPQDKAVHGNGGFEINNRTELLYKLFNHSIAITVENGFVTQKDIFNQHYHDIYFTTNSKIQRLSFSLQYNFCIKQHHLILPSFDEKTKHHEHSFSLINKYEFNSNLNISFQYLFDKKIRYLVNPQQNHSFHGAITYIW